MIRVTVELVPYGIGEPRVIGQAIIANDLDDTLATDGKKGSYTFRIDTTRKNAWRTGRVRNFPRKSLNAWHLLARCLEEAGVK